MYMLFVFFAGAILSIPYCFLAGWSWESQKVVGLFAWFFLFLWNAFTYHAGVFDDWKEAFTLKSRQPMTWPSAKIGFWAWTISCLVPVFLHLISLLMNVMGSHHAAEILQKYRYVASLVCFTLVAVGFTVWRIYVYPKELAADMKYLEGIIG